eukprot:symbB.v1.2.004110.t1/scaffold231.1/size297012/13
MEDCCYSSLTCLASKQITKEAFGREEEERRPFVLKEFVGKGFLSWWRDEVLQRHGSKAVYFVEACGITGQRGLTESTLEVFANECEKLSDRRRFAYFQGHFMATTEDLQLMQLLYNNLPEALPRGEEDFFGCWPRKLAPALTLQVAGAGARTQLIRSGLEAPQWILCLTGKIRLKLLPDERCEGGRLAPLCPFREPMGIFDEAGRPLFTVCEHYLSDVDLFATELLQSSITHLAFGPDLERFPEAAQLPTALEVLLLPGEMACLPAGCWVQSYSDEASWCLQSFYANLRSLDRILEAILAHAAQEEEIFGYNSLPPEAKVDTALSAVLGRNRGWLVSAASIMLHMQRRHLVIQLAAQTVVQYVVAQHAQGVVAAASCFFVVPNVSSTVSPVPLVHSLKLEGDVANSTSEVRADGGKVGSCPGRTRSPAGIG